ncbi:cytochrome c biogenesis CcdA family protein [archaeon]|nr:cytochrome c biogenesis CcdA family protein [archaeon]
MKKLIFTLIFIFFASLASAIPETEVSYFYSVSCSHCEEVVDSNILENISKIEGVSVEKYEVTSPINRERYLDYLEMFGIKGGGIPFLVIEKNGEFSYLMGDTPIIEDLENSVLNFRAHNGGNITPVRGELNLWVIIIAALIDSVNPCAFGVLLFLMAILLTMGSAKRALRSGIIYTGVIFLVYLAAGFGIMKFASSFLVLDNVKIFVGIIVLIGALIEFKDFFWEGKGFSLAIPKSAKPWLEKYARRGTFFSLIILGTLVALVELPCTGGIYLAILSLIANSGIKGTFYLILYNLIFVLPLILISYFVYRGTKVDVVNKWVQKNKRFMRLAAGIVMLGLGLSLLGII